MTGASRDRLTRRDFGKLLGAAAIAGTAPTCALPVSEPLPAADDICAMTAVELADRIRRKDLSAKEVMTAHLARIEAVNPKINAIVTLVADKAMADATEAD